MPTRLTRPKERERALDRTQGPSRVLARAPRRVPAVQCTARYLPYKVGEIPAVLRPYIHQSSVPTSLTAPSPMRYPCKHRPGRVRVGPTVCHRPFRYQSNMAQTYHISQRSIHHVGERAPSRGPIRRSRTSVVNQWCGARAKYVHCIPCRQACCRWAAGTLPCVHPPSSQSTCHNCSSQLRPLCSGLGKSGS